MLALAALALGRSLFGAPFVPFDVFEWITRHVPGAIITAAIDWMIAAITALGVHPTAVAAKLAEQGLAVAMFVAGTALLVAIAARIATTRSRALVACMVVALSWLVLDVVARASVRATTPGTIASSAIVLGAWGVVLGLALDARRALAAERVPRAARRRFLLAVLGGVAATSTVMLGIAAALRGGRSRRERTARIDATGTSGPAASPPADELAARPSPVTGTRPEITPNDRFYRVDINLEPPAIDASAWRLAIGGLVARPMTLALDELRDMAATSQMITLECISNPVGGDLIGTSRWTGVPLRDVLARAGLRDGVRAVHVAAADGFYESIAMEDVEDPRTLLVYEMNREPLAPAHGFPLRVYIPNRHGMKQPKWITKLVASDRNGPGYWVDRGWSATAIPHTTSVIDTIDGDAIGGIAFAGARGISRVEVRIDDGPWNAAQLIAPPVGPLCWVQWRYTWPTRVPGRHTFRVRAYDGSGALQTAAVAPPHPDGATGIHAVAKSTRTLGRANHARMSGGPEKQRPRAVSDAGPSPSTRRA